MNFIEIKNQVEEYAKKNQLNLADVTIGVSLAPMEDDTNLIRYNGEVSEVVLHQGEIVFSIDGFKVS